MQSLFAVGFGDGVSTDRVRDILPNLGVVDQAIALAAPEWPIDKVAKIDLAILRLAVYELMIVRSVPPKVVIDEAVELAKEFGNENSSKFVNGALGTILKSQNVMTISQQ